MSAHNCVSENAETDAKDLIESLAVGLRLWWTL